MVTGEQSQETLLILAWSLPKMKQGFRTETIQVGDYLKMLGQNTYFSMCFVGAEHIHCVRKKSGGKRFRLLTPVLAETTLKRWLSLSAECVMFNMNTVFYGIGALAGCLT